MSLYVTQSPEEDIASILGLLEKVKKKHQIEYDIVDVTSLAEEKRESMLESLRVLSRKKAIGVVSRGRGALPISRSGKLGNMGILVRTRDGTPDSVYPHVKNGKRIDCVMHLKELIHADNIDELKDEESISEQDISRMITSLPELIEGDMKFLETEVETDGGRIDAVFRDRNGNALLIEIELKADDNAIAQVQRFKIPYSEKFNVPLEKIRLGIVCTDIGKSRQNACLAAGIEVYKLNLLKLT